MEKKTTKKRFGNFFWINLAATLVDLIFYTLVLRIFGIDSIFIATLVGGIVGTTISYIMNTKITWKHCRKNSATLIGFFAWNGFKIFVLNVFLTWLFQNLSSVYEFAFSITNSLHLPFDYAFVESTGVFCFRVLTTMLMSFLIYDKIVFKHIEECGQKKNVKSVRQTGKEEKSETEGKK